MIDGPIADVRDALTWVRNVLPRIAQTHGAIVNTDKVVAVGWSTGGHLAMTMAWTCREVHQAPPTAILNFYGPTNFESEGQYSHTVLPMVTDISVSHTPLTLSQESIAEGRRNIQNGRCRSIRFVDLSHLNP